jgi:hypothetical protein
MPTVEEVLPVVREYYANGNPTGGWLHIVLDDGNTEDESVRDCLKWAEEDGDVAGVALARLLLEMTETQRDELYQRYDRYKHRNWLGLLNAPPDEEQP